MPGISVKKDKTTKPGAVNQTLITLLFLSSKFKTNFNITASRESRRALRESHRAPRESARRRKKTKLARLTNTVVLKTLSY